MLIRRATEEDRIALFKLAAAMHAETDFRHFAFDPHKTINGLGAWIHSPNALLLVADAGDGVVGMLAASLKQAWFSHDPFMSEDFFYVAADRRGSRAAYMLMREFMRESEKIALHVRAGVATGNCQAAERLYEHFGMTYQGGNYSAHLQRTT